MRKGDDFYDLNFFKELLPSFKNSDVNIAYAKSVFHKEGINREFMTNYLSELWSSTFCLEMNEIVFKFSHKNLIPNVSSCIFRKPSDSLLNTVMSLHPIEHHKLVFDWIFYSYICKNFKIYYSNKNY